MKSFRWLLSLLLITACPVIVQAQKTAPRDVLLLYKDGFLLKGRISEGVSKIIFDPASGASFSIPSGEFTLDDRVRNVFFSPGQLQKVIQLKPSEIKDPITHWRFKSAPQGMMPQPHWEFEPFPKWSEKGERIISITSPKNKDLIQRIALLTSHHLYGVTIDHKWDIAYFTREMGPQWTRSFLGQIYNEKNSLKQLKEHDKMIEIAAFMQEAGWYEEAEKELIRCMNNYPAGRKTAKQMLTNLQEVKTNLFVESIEQAFNVGQHQEAIDRLETYDREDYQKLVTAQNRATAQKLKVGYQRMRTEMDEARRLLKALPELTKSKATWSKASAFIGEELNYDTVERLESFLELAAQFELQRKEKRKTTQTAEEVLALAISGWLQGKQSALPDPKNALKLAKAREFVLEYLRADGERDRADLLSGFKIANDLPIDVLARLVRMTPPSHAYDKKKIGTDVITQAIKVPEGGGGAYLVQLPPDYHHLRAYPVLMVLHSGRDKPDDALARFKAEAAKRGFILVAPLWAGQGRNAKYQYSEKEHALAIDTLRDLRRRFQVDSDRVFLFGWEDGANMAFDVGLGHPDLFAGVLPMNGTIQPFAKRFYWPNAQYVPFYVVDGERNAQSTKIMRDLFKDSWGRDPYMITYAEYKGRFTEWYSAEVPMMMDWMSRKKRHYPMKEMGRYSSTRSLGEEFHSSRSFDNRFYWLSSEKMTDAVQVQHKSATWATAYRPASFQGNLGQVNKINTRKEAEIWTEANLRVSGVKQLTLWLTPNMIDFKEPFAVRVNAVEVLGKRLIQPKLETMLDELQYTGDRQRLYYAKIELRL